MSTSSLNVAEWSVDQVADWLSGLGPTVARYVPVFRERGLDGAKLLTLRCDDLEYLGMHIIGHQELLLEAVEHLRNFQYELSRECVQQLALRVSVVATTLARALRHHADARLDTQTLADVARTVHAVKPLVCWLDRWPLCASNAAAASLAERKAALLQLSLEAATCAQRDRFAEQPARQVAAAAATTAATADYIIQDVSDPLVLQPASLDAVSLRQAGRPLGFDVVPSFCGHHQLADIRFGSPAHASGAVHAGDEIVQVAAQCVIGWRGDAVLRACARHAQRHRVLPLRVRRRGARPPALVTPQLRARRLRDSVAFLEPPPASPPATAPEPKAPAADDPASDSDDSEPLSPPASPTRLDHARMYPPKPRAVVQRRHTVGGATPTFQRAALSIHQFWQELRAARWGEAAPPAEADDVALYARDKAVSCSTGLERSPRPRTCAGVEAHADGEAREEAREAREAKEAREARDARAKLDKSHSTPAYDFGEAAPSALAATPIPESPADSPPANPLAHAHDKADRILDFKKSSSQIGEAILQQRSRRITDEKAGAEPDPEGEAPARDEAATERILETINIAMMEHRRRSVLQRAADAAAAPQPGPGPGPSPEPRHPGPRPAPCPPPRPAPLAPPTPSVPSGPPAPATPSVPSGPFPVLRAVSRAEDPPSPLKPHRPIDAAQISVPLRHITKHDIRVVASARREMPAINGPPPPPPPAPRRRDAASPPPTPPSGDIVVGAEATTRGAALSPGSAVRGIFPSSKTRSLKKKSSILAKRRCVSFGALAARAAAGGVWQRVRARAAAQPRWARRQLLLTHNLLYAYRAPECAKADCMIYLEGYTVSAAGEVKSRPHAFKVYHALKTFYFACDTREAMLAWIQLIHRATLLPSLTAQRMDVSKQFSETDYSENESDAEGPHRERDGDRDREKDKSKFGSLKKLTVRMQRSESQENVPHSSTSLDRKYLRFFSRNKSKDDAKVIKGGKAVPVPTEQYRSYRRPPGGDERRRPAEPLHYIHASNPNLLELDTSDLVTKPTLRPRPKPQQESLSGLVTLEQFMLDKQAEERRQLYSNRVLMGVETRDRALQRRLNCIVPDVIYGEVPRPREAPKPISVKGKDGYERIVYPDEAGDEADRDASGAHEQWRDSLRRNDKVHTTREPEAGSNLRSAAQGAPPQPMPLDSWSGAAGGAAPEGPSAAGGTPGGTPAGTPGGPGVSRLRLMFSGGRAREAQRQPGARMSAQYAHLQCPPTFQPETYSLARLGPRPPPH